MVGSSGAIPQHVRTRDVPQRRVPTYTFPVSLSNNKEHYHLTSEVSRFHGPSYCGAALNSMPSIFVLIKLRRQFLCSALDVAVAAIIYVSLRNNYVRAEKPSLIE